MSLFILFACLGIGGICAITSEYRSGRFILSLTLTALQGIAALFAVNIIGSLIGTHININPFSLCVSGVFGTAGVILMLLINSIIK